MLTYYGGGSGGDVPSSSGCASGSPFRLTISGVTKPVPVSPKHQPLEDKAYADMAALSGAFTFRASKWNCNPSLTSGGSTDVVVVRGKEALPLVASLNNKSSGSTGAGGGAGRRGSVSRTGAGAVAMCIGADNFGDDGEPTSWRMIEIRRDEEAAGGRRVTLVAEAEDNAHREWEVACTTSEGVDEAMSPVPAVPPSAAAAGGDTQAIESSSDVATKGVDSSSAEGTAAATLVPATDATTTTTAAAIPSTSTTLKATGAINSGGAAFVSSYRGQPAQGAVAHANTRLTLEKRSSPEALEAVAATDPLFVQTVTRLLQLVRPLSFAQ